MSLGERIEIAAHSFWAWAGAAIGGGFLWLIRQVLTNQKQIAMLEQEIKHRDQLRSEDREALHEVRTSVKRIEDVLMNRSDK